VSVHFLALPMYRPPLFLMARTKGRALATRGSTSDFTRPASKKALSAPRARVFQAGHSWPTVEFAIEEVFLKTDGNETTLGLDFVGSFLL